jgi:hypothetical protein
MRNIIINSIANFNGFRGPNHPKRFNILLLIIIVTYILGLWFDTAFFIRYSIISSIWLLLFYIYNYGYIGKYKLLDKLFSELSIIFKMTLPLIYLIPAEFHVLVLIRFIFSLMLMLFINRTTISIFQCITLLMGSFISRDTFDFLKQHLILGVIVDGHPISLTQFIPGGPPRQIVVDTVNRALIEVGGRPPHVIATLAENAMDKMRAHSLAVGDRRYNHDRRYSNHQSILTFEEYAAVKIVYNNYPPLQPRVIMSDHIKNRYGALTTSGDVTMFGRNKLGVYGSLAPRSGFVSNLDSSIIDYKQRYGI